MRLYHTKNHWGTTTQPPIIAKRTILYHTKNHRGTTTFISKRILTLAIIPYQEPPGNYNPFCAVSSSAYNYTIPRTTGELQRAGRARVCAAILYHTKNHRGTTTLDLLASFVFKLYHTKNHRGTTILHQLLSSRITLYHINKHR